MTLAADDPRSLEAASQGGTALRWGTAAVTVLTAYSAAVWLALSLPDPEGARGELQEAVMIELEPLTALEEAPPPAPEPEVVEEVAEPAPTPPEPVAEPVPEPPEPEALPEPPPPEPTPPEPVVEQPPPEPVRPEPLPEPPPPEPQPPEPVIEEPPPPVEEPEPVPEPTTQEVVPDLTETNAIAAAVLNPPVPTLRPPPPRPPVVAERKPKVERPKPVRPKVQPKPRQERQKKAAERPARQARSAAPRSDAQAASRSASAPRVSSASWQRQAVSHFRKYRRRLETREKGTARVSVTIDRSGRVVGASLAASSGSSALDGEALALVRRASPIPAPPDGVGGRTLTFAVPVSM